jgi:methionyl-tRNA formyltransferase
MIICIAGKNSIATSALIHSIELFGSKKIVACPNPSDDGVSRWQPSLRRYAQEFGIKIVSLEELYEIKDLIFLSLEYEKLIRPEKFLSSELFNIHFSKLPSYKGMYTSAWPILNGELHSGVTLHKIDSGIDTGEIINQKTFLISRDETARTLYFKYLEHGLNLFKENICNLVNKNYASTPQKDSNSSYFSKDSINYRDLKINLLNTAEIISRELRAFTFREYQLPIIKNIKIGNHEILTQRSSLEPGTLIQNNHGWTLSTIDHDLFLEEDLSNTFFDWLNLSIDNKTSSFSEKQTRSINVKNKNGWSPLMIAAFSGDKQACNILISSGANVNDANENGTTPLMYAKDFCLSQDNFDFCKFLIQKGANPNQKDHFGKNVLDYAMANKQSDAVHFFKRYVHL